MGYAHFQNMSFTALRACLTEKGYFLPSIWNSLCQYSCYAHSNSFLNGKCVFRKCCSGKNALSKHSERLKERAAMRFCFRIFLQSLFICLASHAVQQLSLEDTLFLPAQELNTNELIQLRELNAFVF